MTVGKKITDLTASGSLKDTDLAIVHDGNGTKRSTLTQLSEYLGNKFSNPNLLINPDFKINQRGKSTYTSGYSVDRWMIASATLNATTMTLSNPNSIGGTLLQYLEGSNTGTFTVTLNVASVTGTVCFAWKDGTKYKRGTVIKKGVNTYTFSASSLTCVGIEIYAGASVQLSYMKLEEGSVATSFIAPNRAEEFVKCSRFFQSFQILYSAYCIVEQHYYQKLPLVTPLRTKPTISTTEQYTYNIYSKSIDWRTDGGVGWLNLDVRPVNNSHTVCQTICNCDAEIY